MRRRAPPAVVVLEQGGANQVHRWRAAAPASIFNCDNFDQGGLNTHILPRAETHNTHFALGEHHKQSVSRKRDYTTTKRANHESTSS